MQNNRDYKLYVDDIILSMNRIEEYIADYDFIHFKRDYKTVDAVIRNFEIIGEASKNIPEEIKENYPNVPWQEMYCLRNKIAHEYHGIDYTIIWDIATNYLPNNKLEIEQILNTI